MENKNPSISRLLTPILIIAVLLFAGIVALAGHMAYQRELHNVESITHAHMKSLILDLEAKLVPIESAMMAESHRQHISVKDSNLVFECLEELVTDQKFIRHAGLEIWAGEWDKSDETQIMYVTRKPDGSFQRTFIASDKSDTPEELKGCIEKAIRTELPAWSYPYNDTLLAKSYVVSCYTKAEDKTAMWCADIEMNALLSAMDSLQFYKNSRLYLQVPQGDIYTLVDGDLIDVEKIGYDNKRFTKIFAHYRHLDLDIIDVVSNDLIFSSLWRNILIVFAFFIAGITFLSVLVHRSFKKAQESLSQSINKSHTEELALKRMEDEIAIASRIQNKMLTSPGVPVRLEPPEGKPADIMSRIIPAREVGGDLYEYRLEGNNIVVCVGDVSGKGMPASIVMSKCITLFHAYVSGNAHPDPSKLLNYLNGQLCRRNDDMMFVTMWTGVLDLTNGHLEYSSAGHNPPVLIRDGSARFMDLCQGLPLGMFKDNVYPLNSCDLDSRETLLLYTDGITEAEGPGNALFGDDRLLNVCASSGSGCPEVVCQSVLNAVFAHAAGCRQSDDITLLCFSFGDRYTALHSIKDVPAIHSMLAGCAGEDEAALVLEESAVNAFVHGRARFVYAECKDGVFTMADDGDEFDPTTYKVPDLADGELRIGGRGIPLVRMLCSKVTYLRTEYGINIQTFTLNNPAQS